MNLDHPAGGDLLLGQKALDLLALVALELDDLSELLVLDDAAVAAKLLLESLGEFGQVELVIQPLDGGQRLAAVALLQANVNDALGDDLVIAVGVGKRVKWRGDASQRGLFVGHQALEGCGGVGRSPRLVRRRERGGGRESGAGGGRAGGRGGGEEVREAYKASTAAALGRRRRRVSAGGRAGGQAGAASSVSVAQRQIYVSRGRFLKAPEKRVARAAGESALGSAVELGAAHAVRRGSPPRPVAPRHLAGARPTAPRVPPPRDFGRLTESSALSGRAYTAAAAV